MPRRRRPDLSPEILLRDDRYQRLQANQAVDDGWYVPRVRRDGDKPINDGFIPIMNTKQLRLRAIKRCGGKLDEGLVAYMMENCAQAQVVPVFNANGLREIRDGFLVYRLARVGCRLYMTQAQIAHEYGCSRQNVNSQIKEMKRYRLIVNQGHGWYEFAAILCWRGYLEIQAAYRQQQRARDGRVVTDGTTTLVAPDMDADDGDHSPQGVEEEEG